MRRHIMAAALLPCFVATSAFAQGVLPNATGSGAGEQVEPTPAPATPPTRGVNIYQSLRPTPPTGTSSQTIPTIASTAPTDGTVSTGYDAGTVTFDPSVTAATYYDDNVFALPTNRLGDWAFVLRPELSFRSKNWDNVDVGGNVYVEGRQYATYESESQVNAGASIGGTARLGDNNQIVGRLQYVRGHEDRGVSDTITDRFINPIGFHQGEAAAALNSRLDHWWSSVGGTALFEHYESAILEDGLVASQAYRNGNIERFPLRLGYVVAPFTSVFVEGSAHRRDFDVSLYDSIGYRVVGGLLLEPGEGRRVRGEVTAGYMEQNYSGATLKRISTWTAAGSMSFLLTDSWTFTLEGRRDPREASYSGGVFLYNDGVSIIESVVTARTDYHILPNLSIGAGGSYINDRYIDAGRTDWAWAPVASVKYGLTSRIAIGFDYKHIEFNSSGLFVPGYTRNVYLLSTNFKF